jgi:hypothetical protein
VEQDDDGAKVISRFRLGWFLAEVRGWSRPRGPVGAVVPMASGRDRPLPLRIDRSPSELRIQALDVVIALQPKARDVGDSTEKSLASAIDADVRAVSLLRAEIAYDALNLSAKQLQTALGTAQPPVSRPVVEEVRTTLADALELERITGTHRASNADEDTDEAREFNDRVASSNEEAATVLTNAVEAVDRALSSPGAIDAAPALREINAGLDALDKRAESSWDVLADEIWGFDAAIQDELTAHSEEQACAYQLGRALAETYWALDPIDEDSPSGWRVLLSERRCNELSRLVGRLSKYMGAYTPAAVAGSLAVWQEVAATPQWRANGYATRDQLYLQIRRWYELIVLEQDPTTLIRPYEVLKSYRAVRRLVKSFLPQLIILIVGIASLVTLLALLSADKGSSFVRTVTALLAVTGLTLAGVTTKLKNSAQSLLVRLRQDAYSDLVAIAVQTAPTPPKGLNIREVVGRRRLTPATAN